MAENLDIEGRQSVRTPMQWRAGPTAGFSTAPAGELTRPLPDDDRFGPAAVNVADQKADPDSLLRWFERLIRLRKELPEIGFGSWDVLDVADPAVVALRYEWEGRVVLTVHHLDDREAEVTIPLGGSVTVSDLLPFDLDRQPCEQGDGSISLSLGPYDHRWLRIEEREGDQG
jgi:maltose alpha-D-glucosyltransferase/alpha-amylase